MASGNAASAAPARVDIRTASTKCTPSYLIFGVPLLYVCPKTGRLRSTPKHLVGNPPREWSRGATGVFAPI
jgi:hypothetical protein